jgi:uncharacterized RDD family membrane protein YckC
LTVSGLFPACNTWLAIETVSSRDTVTPVPETASWGRRVLALLVDWFACLGVAELLVQADILPGNPFGIYTLGFFVLESALFTALLGGSFGQLATRLRVVRADGGRLDVARALLRSVMIALVIPPLVFRPDGRGLHDMTVGSYVVPLQVR